MWFVDILFPRQCFVCWENWNYLCNECKKQLSFHPEVCPWCLELSKNFRLCSTCKTTTDLSIEWVVITYTYSTEIKKLVSSFKYSHAKDIGNFLSEKMYLSLASNTSISFKNTFISFVPMHWIKKHFIRWYNPAEVLAGWVSNLSNLPLIRFINKTKLTLSQTYFGRRWRLSNVSSSIWLDDLDLSWYENLILVDDIYTTWATIKQISSIIKTYYPHIKIWWCVLARHLKKN